MGCGSRYQPDPTIGCENPLPNHVVCSGFDTAQWAHVHWDCPTYELPPESETKSSGREKARKIAARTEPPWTMMDVARRGARRQHDPSD